MNHSMINVANKQINIHISQLIKPYYISNIEFFEAQLRLLRPLAQDHTVIVEAVNTPLMLPMFNGLIDIIADTLDIPASRLLIKTRDPHCNHPKATIMRLPIWGEEYRMQVKQALKGLNFCTQPVSRRFGALFGRIQWARLKLAYHLETQHADQSFVVVLADKDQYNHYPLSDEFVDIKKWWMTRTNPTSSTAHNSRGEYNFPDNIKTWPSIWGLYDIEIIVETEYQTPGDWTEKTWKCLGSGKPFIAINGAGSLAELKKLGFETYSPCIDESYDFLPSYHDRIDACCNEIDRLAAMSSDQWQVLMKTLTEIANRNKQIFFEKKF